MEDTIQALVEQLDRNQILREWYDTRSYGEAMVDSNGYILTCNVPLAEMLGVGVGDLKIVSDLFNPAQMEGADDKQKCLTELLEGSRPDFTSQCVPVTVSEAETEYFNIELKRFKSGATISFHNITDEISNFMYDGMTDLYSRIYFDKVIKPIQLKKAKDEKKHLGVIVFDLDEFKEVNDKLGHDVGDEIIKAYADVVLQNTRQSDFAVHHGGDEVVVICPDCTLEELKKITERYQAAINRYNQKKDNPFLHLKPSYGYFSDNKDHDQIFKRADEFMFQRKEAKKKK